MLRITMSIAQSPRARGANTTRLAIIGGGYTGAIIARHLAERAHERIDQILVFEPRAELGAGLAYSAPDPSLRLNVAAHRMRAVPGDPGAFAAWLKKTGRLSADVSAVTDSGIYARRSDFGDFMGELLRPHMETGRVLHVREQVVSMERTSAGWTLFTKSGTPTVVDAVVIATGHAPAKTPFQIPTHLMRTGQCIAAGDIGGLKRISTDETILIVGSGLSALDALSCLKSRNHRGPITILSRSGLLPRSHARGDFSPYGDFTLEQPTAISVLRRFRDVVAELTRDGVPWQSAMDALRHQGQTLWMQMPQQEQRRVLRHLRRWYEVHRFRVPPQIEALLQTEVGDAPVTFLSGRLTKVGSHGDRIRVDLSRRITRTAETLEVDRIIVATGPDQSNVLDYQPFLKNLADQGILRPDRLGLGIDCDHLCRAISLRGNPQPSIVVAGPLTRGRFGEITGVPEIASQASAIVDYLLRWSTQQTRTIEIGA
ncbi:FAD/NAD(P)-binding protein [Rhizobium sp. G187]|uniref:FAD/NAD(P)-binding protein n=1 Tax=Rhizobium sp. G187 TaxID=3451352 RepID=UPI003EE80A84